LAKKQKEVEALLREKKCKNCILCLDDLKDKASEIVIKDLNERIIAKTNKIATLEDQVRKSSAVINQVCQHTFSLLRTKATDFLKQQDTLKEKYESRLMELEDRLSSEHQQHEILLKAKQTEFEERMKTLKK